MKRALFLADKAKGQTTPNPLVGAVIAKAGKIVGEGYHAQAGGPHAEIIALEQAKQCASGATLYINLEPCCHYGRTPPCTKAIIDSGIKKVVLAMSDPNPLVSGKGKEELIRAGIPVETGMMAQQARQLNEVFIKYITTKNPFVILKAAISLDGKIAAAGGQSRWITGTQSRRMSHLLRQEVDAILVGKGTVLADDPLLTVRLPEVKPKNPIKVVLDSTLEISPEAKILSAQSPAPTIIATTQYAPKEKIQQLEEKGVRILILPEKDHRVDLLALMKVLAQKEITSIMIEGGGEVNDAALHAGIVDKIIFFIAPIILGGRSAPNVIGGAGFSDLKKALRLEKIQIKRLGRDHMLQAYIKQKRSTIDRLLAR
jgi:diaminohydroxyphosphoribosylaminopyrimidine deaminase/5-amino-6-(5-phosphoribosylamino)uracil reductase